MTDNEFAPLFEELVQQDCYRLRTVPFQPDVILDIGANVGVFTSCARFLFPSATIVAIEPNPRNWGLLNRHTRHLPNVTLLMGALGTGPLWRELVEDIRPPYYGGGNRYLTAGQLGCPLSMFDYNGPCSRAVGVVPMSLSRLVDRYAPGSIPLLVKIDIEGGENCIFNHEPSMAALRRIDYLAMEVHYPVDGTGPVFEPGKPTIRQSLMSLADTHDCVLDEPRNLFYATRRKVGALTVSVDYEEDLETGDVRLTQKGI